MRKRDELTSAESCMGRAREDEMTFVLLGRDIAAPYAIRAWAAERIVRGKNKPDDPQIVEALECAKTMERELSLRAAIKVFAMNDWDWMAGPDLDAAVELYLREFSGGCPASEALDEPHEVSEEQMGKLVYAEDDDGPPQRRTFRQQLDRMIASGQSFPCFFASSEY